MIRNFFTVAVRNFLRHRFYSFINVFGLTSGLACALCIYLWVRFEISTDRFHKDIDRIYHVVSNQELADGRTLTWPITPGPMAEDIRETLPEVEMAARTIATGTQLFQYEDKSFMEAGYYADPEFLKIFSFKFLEGTPNAKRDDVSSISISKKLATKLFGQENPIGKTVRVNRQNDFTVTAVFDDITSESSLQFEYVLPFEVYKKASGEGFNWGNYDFPLYLKLTASSNVEDVMRKLNERMQKLGRTERMNFYIQPFAEYYLNSQFEDGRPAEGRIRYVRIFSIVAVFILVIACINFMNMATAKAATRAKEVGIRKVAGAQRQSLIFQFIAESVFISFLSMVFAVTIVYMLLPLFNTLVSKHITIDFTSADFLMSALAIVLITGILAGSYPAFFLSSYKPVHVLKGTMATAFSGASLRKILVVFQFALTVILITASLVIFNQINYIHSKDVGYNRQSVLTFSLRGDLQKEFETFKNEALQFPGIKKISLANQSLVEVGNQNGSVDWPGEPEDSQIFFRTVVVDFDFLETMGLELQKGRFFSREHHDTSNFILTQRSVEVMGLKDPIGQTISQWGNPGKVVGVVKDFHSRSLHEAMDPIVFMCKPEWTGVAYVRFEGTEAQVTLEHLEKLHKKYNPEYPFAYSFVEDDFARLYRTEQTTGALALGFTVMAIIISGLGLLGLAAYTAERKKKEIGIRKTLGASVAGIVSMISKDFIQLSLVAAVIGCPVAYYLMQKFLEGYAYHVELGWDVFVITAIIVACISLFTVIFQVTKAALANPVDALRNE